MTVDTQPTTGFPDPADFGVSVVEADDLPPRLDELVEQVRRLVDATAHTEVDPRELAAVSAAVSELTERLNTRRRDTGVMVRRQWPDGHVDYGTLANIVAGPTNPAAPPLRMARTEDGVAAEITLNGLYEGPPTLAHGGWIAALLDQALGEAAAARGVPGLTANLDVNYRNPTPLHAPLTVTAWVTGIEGRKVHVAAEIRHDGTLTAEGTALMVRFPQLG